MTDRPRGRLSGTWLAKLAGLAAAYYLTGNLALLLAIPPGYATAIWPPAGIALAGLLVLGLRAWPAVFLGSVAVNLVTSLDLAASGSLASSLALTAAIGAGAALQACVGTLLFRRFVGASTALDNERDVGRFLLLAGVSCLLNPTLAVSALLLTGTIDLSAFAFSWCTWWVGDLIGVIIVTPLVLLWLSRPAGAWRSRPAAVTWPLAIVTGLIVLFFVRANIWEQQRIRRDFEERASRMADALRERLRGDVEVLESSGALFSSTGTVGRSKFRSFAQAALARHPGIQALGWNTRVPGTSRRAYEREMQQEGYPGFGITQLALDGRLVPAERRDEYFVVSYVEPFGANSAALGFDVASDPARREILAVACDRGEATALPGIRLVQDSAGQEGLLVFRPVFATDSPQTTVEERRRALRGYVTAVFRLGVLVETSLRGSRRPGIELALYVETAPGQVRLLYVHGGDRPGAAPATGNGRTEVAASSTFGLAGRRWTARLTPTSEYLAERRGWEPWFVLAGGLVFTGLLGAFLLVITGRASRVQLLVEQRTVDLAESSAALRRLGSIVESSPDAIIGMTTDGQIVSWNRGAVGMYGYRPEEVRGRHISLLHPSDGPARDPRLLQRVAGGTLVLDLETVNVTKDQRQIDVSLTISPIRDADGAVVGAATIARDITDRKRIEHALDTEREFLKAVLDSLTEGVVACDGNGTLTVFNDATREFHGLPPEDIPPEQWAQHYDLLLADGTTLMRTEEIPLFRALRGETVSDVEMVIAPRGRPTRTLLVNGRAIVGPGGERLGAVVAMHDITERKALQLTREEFVGTVSHELRTPLTAIKGFLELLADGDAGPVNDTQREFLDIAVRNTDRLGALVNDLLDVNKIQSQRFDTAAGPVDLTQVLADVAATYGRMAEAKGLSFQTQIGPSLRVAGDRERLVQAFGNLVSNAIKYTPRGSVGIEACATPHGIEIAVRDTGIGVPGHEQSRLFTKFFRGRNPVVAEAGGTGLGLVIVKAIVERHGGGIRVESQGEGGACFRVVLPPLVSGGPAGAAAA